MTAPAGAIVLLNPFDTDAEVDPGDIIETSTGRRYLVDDAVLVRRRRPAPGRRWRVTAVVMRPDDPTPATARVHTLSWYPR